MADIQYIISVDAASGKASLQEFSGALDGLKTNSETADKAQGSLWGGVAAGTLVAQGVTKAVEFISSALAGAKQEFLDSERASFLFTSTLKNMGIESEANEKRFDDFANSIQDLTTVDDDAAKSIMGLGLRMGISADQIEDATKSAIGLSKSFGIDLESAMKMVAQATEGNFAMMGRYVPQLKSAESASDKMAIATKAMADGFKIAQDETETAGGKLEQTRNQINNTKESIGELAVRFESLTMKAIEPCVNILSDFVAWLDQVDQRSLKDNVAKRWQENKEAFEAAAKAAGILEQETKKLFEDHGNISKTEQGVALYAAALDDLIATSAKATKGYLEWKAAQDGVAISSKAVTLTTEAASKAEEERRKRSAELKKAVDEARKAEVEYQKALEKTGRVLLELNADQRKYMATEVQVPGVIEESEAAIQKRNRAWGIQIDIMGRVSKEVTELTKTELEKMNEVLDATTNVMAGIAGLYEARYQQRQQQLEESYQAEVFRIQQSKMTEEEKNVALSKLEEAFTKKSEELRKASAKKQKEISLFTAIINVAQGFTKALAEGGPILGPILGALVLAAGAIQIATIKAQPLAKGGIFQRPTLLASPSGNNYEVAENREPEVVAPLSGLRRALGMGGGSGGMGGMGGLVIHNHIILDSREMKSWISKVVEDRARGGKMKISSKAVS